MEGQGLRITGALALLSCALLNAQTITSISPSSVAAGGPDFALTVTGRDFSNGYSIYWNGVSHGTNRVSSTTLITTIRASELRVGGNVRVYAALAFDSQYCPNPCNASNIVNFAVNNPRPIASSLSPSLVGAGGPSFTLTIFGSNFNSTTQVLVNSTLRTINSVNSAGTQIQVVLSASDIARAGTVQIMVQNPSPGGGVSAFLVLTVSSPAVIALSTPAVEFRARLAGANPEEQAVMVSNAGGGRLTWQAAASSAGSWLAVEPTSGTNTGVLVVSARTAGLSPGNHQGTVTVTAESAVASTISVGLSLSPPPALSVQKSLVFVARTGEPVPTSRELSIEASDKSAIAWSAVVSSGNPWLSVTPGSGVTPGKFTVQVNPAGLSPGAYSGSVTLTSAGITGADNNPLSIAVGLAIDTPAPFPEGTVSAASFQPERAVSPGGLLSLFGMNLAAGTVGASELPLPRSLGNSQVLVNDVPAPLVFVSPNQINFQLPVETAGSEATLTVANRSGPGLTTTVKLASETPAIFSSNATGTGQAAVLNQDGTLNSSANPARAGSIVQIFATGLGATDPPSVTGQAAGSSPAQTSKTTPIVLFSGQLAQVHFAGGAPGLVGVDQVNASIPSTVTPGAAVTLQLVSGIRLSNLVTIAVR